MKLLFDENLSPRLVLALADVFPGSAHVHTVGLGRGRRMGGGRQAVTHHARWFGPLARRTVGGAGIDGFRCALPILREPREPPPKVVWIRRGNCRAAQIEALLRTHAGRIGALAGDPDTTCLALV